MTLWSELAADRIEVPGVIAGNTEVCLRHVGWHRDPISPLSAVEVEYIDDAEDAIEAVVASENEELMPDLLASGFRFRHWAARTCFPHEFGGPATQTVEFHLFSQTRRHSLKNLFNHCLCELLHNKF